MHFSIQQDHIVNKTLFFLEYQIDTAQRQVLYQQKPLQISNKGFELLLYFAEHAGQTIARDDLIEHIWHDRVISDATLYKQIQRLRQVMHSVDEGKENIRTIHGIGFVFLPEVHVKTHTKSISPDVIAHNKNKNSINKFLFFAIALIISFHNCSRH